MIASMTAFARAEWVSEQGRLSWEIRSVNQRFLELNFRLAEDFRRLEPAIRDRLGRRLSRGKLDCTLKFQAGPGAAGAWQVNAEMVARLGQAAQDVSDILGIPPAMPVMEVLRWPGVLAETPPDWQPLHQAALSLLETALDELVAHRQREGERLAELIRERCAALQLEIATVRERLPQVLAELRERLHKRLAELAQELDQQRLEQEMLLLAQRLDVAEELDRLSSHLTEIHTVLQRDEPLGRRLDFLMQELNREANTLTSKSNDVEITRCAVTMKVLIEQMREQVQNIE